MMFKKDKITKAKLVLLSMVRHPWEQGVAADACMESGEDDIAVLLAHEAAYRQLPDGRLSAVYNLRNITDPCACGRALLFAYEKTGDDFYKIAADRMLAYILSAPGDANGIQQHNYDDPMIAADCSYMVVPFLAAMGEYKEAIRQMDARFKLLWDEDKRLLHHQWNFAKNIWWREQFWGAATGWNIAAIAQTLPYIPSEMHEERVRLIGYLDQMVSGILRYQLDCGLFYDVLDDATTFIETNCAQMVAFGIFRAVKDGYLDKTYLSAANRMREAANAKVDENGFVQGACGAPYFNKCGISPEAQAFYIMMESAAKACLGE